jgi:putative transposase
MARSVRIEFPGAFYHVMARGNRRGSIFLDDEDRQVFLRSLGEACLMTGWKVHAWVLMSNHYHLLLQTPEPNLVEGMKWLQNAYTRRFNTRHKQWGRLFGDRYKSVLVQGEGFYYETLMDYIHLNPARAGLIRPHDGQSLLDYPWSSVARGYALPGKSRPEWLAAEEGLRAFFCADTVPGRRDFVRRLDERILAEGATKAGIPVETAEMDKRRSHLRRGWYWGSQEFAERVLKLAEKILQKDRHWGTKRALEQRAHGEAEARRLLAEGLLAAGLEKDALELLPGSDPLKATVASVIWQRTTVNMAWIAQELHMCSPTNARQQIRRIKRGEIAKQSRQRMKTWPKKFKKWCRQSQMSA